MTNTSTGSLAKSVETALDFPVYSRTEKVVDAMIHWMGVGAALLAFLWLSLKLSRMPEPPPAAASLAVYSLAMIGTFAASAAYNLTAPGRLKERLRRIDHAMIYVMIAGSYTPYAAISLGGREGVLLLAAVWGVAAAGVTLKLIFPRRLERLSLLFYLAMGWMALLVVEPMVQTISTPTLWLLGAGGIVYSLGAGIHSLHRLPFHNAIWHAMVLVAAGLHFAAASLEFLI